MARIRKKTREMIIVFILIFVMLANDGVVFQNLSPIIVLMIKKLKFLSVVVEIFSMFSCMFHNIIHF